MPENGTDLPHVAESHAVSRKRTRLSLVWIVPLVAAAAGIWVAVTRILSEGPTITINFSTADGLEAGKTKIQYNGVEVGSITAVRLSDDHQHVITTAQMAPKTDSLLVADTQFWVVRPRISGANITGLGTLISGAYIGMDIGQSKQTQKEFTALETPPVITGHRPGRFFVLKASDLGSLDTGTPIFYRRLQVGEVASYALDSDGQSLSIKVFVNAPYDQYVSRNTRFWQASGIDVSLTAGGLSVQTQSLLSILVGGIAFETPAGTVLPAAAAETDFPLFNDRTAAFKVTARDPQDFVLIFNESVRGLVPGAPVEFRGIPVGEVVDIKAQIDAKTFQFSAPVTVRLDATRLGVQIVDRPTDADMVALRRQLLENLVEHGVRAQLRSGSILTGAMFVAFDFFPDEPLVKIDWSRQPVQLPTIPGQLEALEAQLTNIVNKLDQIPFKALGDDVRKMLGEVDRTLVSARGALDSGRDTFQDASKLIEPNSVLGAELGNTLQEVSRAARSVRILADFLERHPEALIRGKTGEAQ